MCVSAGVHVCVQVCVCVFHLHVQRSWRFSFLFTLQGTSCSLGHGVAVIDPVYVILRDDVISPVIGPRFQHCTTNTRLSQQHEGLRRSVHMYIGSQLAERLGNRASNPKVAGSIPGRAK